MSLRQYLGIMAFGTALCWTSLVFILLNVDPFQGNTLTFLFFYVSFFFSLLGTCSVAIFFLNWIFRKVRREPLFRVVEKSFRDSVLISALFTFLLYLQAKQLVTIWNFLIFLVMSVCMVILVRTFGGDEGVTPAAER